MIKLKDLLNEGKSERHIVQNFLDKVKKETGMSGYGSSSGNMGVTIPWSNDRKKEEKIKKIAKDMGFKLDGKNNEMLSFHKMATESVSESKYRGNVLADVIEDIIKDEGFDNIDRVEDSRMNNTTYIYLSTRDMKPASEIMKTLKQKYGVEDVGYSKTEVAVTVPSDTLMEERNYIVKEGKYKTYFHSFSGAAEEAAKMAEDEGYEIDEDDWFKQVATGGKYTRSRPSVGDTHRFSVNLTKNGKPARKALHFQVHGMKSGKYELNAYIN